jgi:hypothetical protein
MFRSFLLSVDHDALSLWGTIIAVLGVVTATDFIDELVPLLPLRYGHIIGAVLTLIGIAMKHVADSSRTAKADSGGAKP